MYFLQLHSFYRRGDWPFCFSYRQDETDAKLDALSMDVHKLHGELVTLNERQERHERILERLSLRSIEHEANISGLRRAK